MAAPCIYDSKEVSCLVQHIMEQSVPVETVTILLLFPVIATLVVLLRQVIGMHAFGIYTPSIIAIAFIAIGQENPSNIKYAVTVYLVVLFVGMLMRYVLKKLRLLYLPRVAITITVVTLSVLAFLTFAGSISRIGFAGADLFPILIIITLVEKFVSVQIEKGSKAAIILATETLIIALVGYLLLSSSTAVGANVTDFILRYPYAVLLLIPFHIFLGKWTGLRAAEYMRFHEVLKKIR